MTGLLLHCRERRSAEARNQKGRFNDETASL